MSKTDERMIQEQIAALEAMARDAYSRLDTVEQTPSSAPAYDWLGAPARADNDTGQEGYDVQTSRAQYGGQSYDPAPLVPGWYDEAQPPRQSPPSDHLPMTIRDIERRANSGQLAALANVRIVVRTFALFVIIGSVGLFLATWPITPRDADARMSASTGRTEAADAPLEDTGLRGIRPEAQASAPAQAATPAPAAPAAAVAPSEAPAGNAPQTASVDWRSVQTEVIQPAPMAPEAAPQAPVARPAQARPVQTETVRVPAQPQPAEARPVTTPAGVSQPAPAPVAATPPAQPVASAPAAQTQFAMAPAAPAQAVPQRPQPATITPEMEALFQRGKTALSKGDIAGARLAFKRLADRGHAEAAFAFAETYDPSILGHMAVYGIEPNLDIAWKYYTIAHEQGLERAIARMTALKPGN